MNMMNKTPYVLLSRVHWVNIHVHLYMYSDRNLLNADIIFKTNISPQHLRRSVGFSQHSVAVQTKVVLTVWPPRVRLPSVMMSYYTTVW